MNKRVNRVTSACVAALVLGSAAVGSFFLGNKKGNNEAANNIAQVSMAAYAQDMDLFDSSNAFTQRNAEITLGNTYKFMGHTWRVVSLADKMNNKDNTVATADGLNDTATFWMEDTLIDNVAFDNTPNFVQGANTATMIQSVVGIGYSSNYVTSRGGDGDIGESTVRTALRGQESIFGGLAGKVIPAITNDAEFSLTTSSVFLRSPDGSFYSSSNAITNNFTLTSSYKLTQNDKLWLPSIYDLATWKTLNGLYSSLHYGSSPIENGTATGYSWLRNPYDQTYDNVYASAVNATTGAIDAIYAMNNTVSVRPALNLNISEAKFDLAADAGAVITGMPVNMTTANTFANAIANLNVTDRNGNMLTRGTDYTIKINGTTVDLTTEATNLPAGTANTIEVVGAGIYMGSLTDSFTVTALRTPTP